MDVVCLRLTERCEVGFGVAALLAALVKPLLTIRAHPVVRVDYEHVRPDGADSQVYKSHGMDASWRQ